MSKIFESKYKKEIYLGDVYYSIKWSNYHKVDKYEILKKAPEFSGIFVIFELKGQLLHPFYLGFSITSSLRHDIKFLMDEESPLIDKNISSKLNEGDYFYKYLISESYEDIEDIFDYLKYYYEKKDIKFIQKSSNKASGRYKNVFIKELELNVNYDK